MDYKGSIYRVCRYHPLTVSAGSGTSHPVVGCLLIVIIANSISFNQSPVTKGILYARMDYTVPYPDALIQLNSMKDFASEYTIQETVSGYATGQLAVQSYGTYA